MFPTRPFANTSSPRALRLEGTSILEVAEHSRVAAVAFLAGTAFGWGRRELATWLLGPYRQATAFAEATLGEPAQPTTRFTEPLAVERVLLTARERVIEMLSTRANEWHSFEFARKAIDAGLVLNVQDRLAVTGYIPATHPSMRLYDRVASLFIADFLTRPRDYEDILLCDECGELSFPWASSHHRYCEAIPFTSAIVPRHDAEAPRRTSRGLGKR